jgi:uncharacterized ParB-like nuclease family protein
MAGEVFDMTIKHIAVEAIITEGLQARAAIDPATVREYAEAATEGKATLPPIVVYCHTAGQFWLADGFHRLAAAKQTGQKKIAAEVRQGSRTDALRCALGANQTHGLRRTNADKARAVMMAYEHRKDLGLPDVPSARAIADLVGVNHETVSRQLAENASWREATARTGADGKTREFPPIPTRPPKNPPAAQAVTQNYPPPPVRRPEKQTGTVPVQRPIEKPEPPQVENETETGPVDERGKHIPVDLLPIWNRKQEVQDLATAISRVRVALQKAQDGNDPLWSEINYSSVLNYLDRAFFEITSSKPYVVCPMCQGIGCRACKSRGLMGKYRFDTCVAAEFKQ